MYQHVSFYFCQKTQTRYVRTYIFRHGVERGYVCSVFRFILFPCTPDLTDNTYVYEVHAQQHCSSGAARSSDRYCCYCCCIDVYLGIGFGFLFGREEVLPGLLRQLHPLGVPRPRPPLLPEYRSVARAAVTPRRILQPFPSCPLVEVSDRIIGSLVWLGFGLVWFGLVWFGLVWFG